MEELNSRIGYNLYKAGMLIRREGMRALKQYGITPEQWQLLMILYKHREMTQKEIGDKTIQDAPTVSRTISRMMRDGLISKKRSSKDKRSAAVCVSNKGNALIMNMMKKMSMRDRLDVLLHGFHEKKKKQLIRLLKELRNCLEGSCGTKKSDGGYHD